MAMVKVRQHNEYFRTVSLNGRKSCPCCHAKLGKGESVWSWGEYMRASWYTVMHFCKECFERNVKLALSAHTDSCGCTVQLIGYRGEKLPEWLKVDNENTND